MPPAAPLTRQHGRARTRWQMNLLMLALALIAPRIASVMAARHELALPGGQRAPVSDPHWRGDIGVTFILGIRG